MSFTMPTKYRTSSQNDKFLRWEDCRRKVPATREITHWSNATITLIRELRKKFSYWNFTFFVSIRLNFEQNAFVCTKLKVHPLTTFYIYAVKAGKLRLDINDIHLAVCIRALCKLQSLQLVLSVLKYCYCMYVYVVHFCNYCMLLYM